MLYRENTYYISKQLKMLIFLSFIFHKKSKTKDAAIGFLQQSSISTTSIYLDALCTLALIAPLSCVPDVGFLSKYSAFGLFTILASFITIFTYGILQNGLFQGLSVITWNDLWPQSISECSHWFGITVFSYGLVPTIYNVQESMTQPSHINRATEVALWLVFIIYAIISNGVAIIFSPSSSIEYNSSMLITRHYFDGDVIQHLPAQGLLPEFIRLAMAGVIIVTAPLLIIPCSELLEGRIFKESSNDHHQHQPMTKLSFKSIALRLAICSICTCISVFIPDFVSIISFIGCFAVALVSFVFPPLFYVVLLCTCCSSAARRGGKLRERIISSTSSSPNNNKNKIESNSTSTTASETSCGTNSPTNNNNVITSTTVMQYQNAVIDYSAFRKNHEKKSSVITNKDGFQYYHLLDCGMILLGVFTTIITTYLTFRDLILSKGVV